jgi:cysteine-S-conjugate beta-lyase
MSDKLTSPLAAPAIAFRALNVPVHRASTVLFPDTASFLARRAQLFDGFSYGLYGTPTTRALEQAVAQIDGATRSLLVPSGLAAVTLPTLALLAPGDHLLVADCVYGPTREHCTGTLRRMGMRVDFFAGDAGDIRPLLSNQTRLVILESPGSYSMEMQDIAAICEQAHAAGARVLADNTWGFGSSRLFEHGVDIVATALSKYAGGHSDVCMGSISINDEPLFRQLKSFIAGLGSGVSSDDAYLTHRGLHTLNVRLDEQARRGLDISAWLRRHPAVEQVMNPADPQDAAHARFCASFSRGNGLISFIPRAQDPAALAAMIDGMRCFRIGASWGGTESLVALADLSSARTVRARRAGQFIVRLHLGLEDFATLKADVASALERLQSHST